MDARRRIGREKGACWDSPAWFQCEASGDGCRIWFCLCGSCPEVGNQPSDNVKEIRIEHLLVETVFVVAKPQRLTPFPASHSKHETASFGLLVSERMLHSCTSQ